tara:strand:- start:6306 stop:6554 length:249 start_codon:yes stop_codon:yes gene_type:complete
MDKLKKILIGIAFLIPALVVTGAITFMLAKADYGADPGLEVGLILWGTWALACGFYFKKSKLKTGGIVLLIFAAIGLANGVA